MLRTVHTHAHPSSHPPLTPALCQHSRPSRFRSDGEFWWIRHLREQVLRFRRARIATVVTSPPANSLLAGSQRVKQGPTLSLRSCSPCNRRPPLRRPSGAYCRIRVCGLYRKPPRCRLAQVWMNDSVVARSRRPHGKGACTAGVASNAGTAPPQSVPVSIRLQHSGRQGVCLFYMYKAHPAVTVCRPGPTP